MYLITGVGKGRKGDETFDAQTSHDVEFNLSLVIDAPILKPRQILFHDKGDNCGLLHSRKYIVFYSFGLKELVFNSVECDVISKDQTVKHVKHIYMCLLYSSNEWFKLFKVGIEWEVFRQEIKQ